MQNDAISIVQEDIPEWQIIESRKRLAEMKANSCSAIDTNDFFKDIDDDLI